MAALNTPEQAHSLSSHLWYAIPFQGIAQIEFEI
jgi:hypothetical protein